MDILMNGELYIKRGPEVFVSDNDEYDLLSIIPQLTDDDIDELSEMTDGNITKESVEVLKTFFETDTTDLKSYLGCDQFWYSTINEKDIKMTSVMYGGECCVDYFIDKRKLDEKFISLLSFLDKSEYIGKYLQRTCPIDDYDTSYMNTYPSLSSGAALILYKMNDILLGVEQYPPEAGGIQYGIILPKYTEDGNYIFFGETNDKFKDKPKVYQSIFRQTYRFKNKRI